MGQGSRACSPGARSLSTIRPKRVRMATSPGWTVEAATQIQKDDGDTHCRPEPRRGQAYACERREPVTHADPLLGYRGTPEASGEQGQQHHRGHDLHRLGHEARGLPEGRHGVDLPRPVDPVDRIAGQQGHPGDRHEIDRHHPDSEELQKHDDGADVRGRARQQEHQRGPGTQALQHQRRRDRGGGRSTRVHRDADGEHGQHRDEAAAEDTRSITEAGMQHRDQRGEEHAEHEPVRGLVEQVAEAIGEDPPARWRAGWRSGAAVVLEQRMEPGRAASAPTAPARSAPLGSSRALGWALDAQEVRGDAGRHARHERRDGPEHGHDRVHERVAQRDRVDPDLRSGDEERDGGAPGRAAARQTDRGGDDAARAERQRRADGRSPQDRANLAAAEEPLEQGRRHEDGEDAREDEPRRRRKDASLRWSTPRRPPGGGSPSCGAPAAAKAGSRPSGPASGNANGPCDSRRYFGKYFLSSAQATEYCGSTTLAILMTAV